MMKIGTKLYPFFLTRALLVYTIIASNRWYEVRGRHALGLLGFVCPSSPS